MVSRAREILKNLERDEFDRNGTPRLIHGKGIPAAEKHAAPPAPHPLAEKLKAIDIDATTPLQALQILQELKKDADKE